MKSLQKISALLIIFSQICLAVLVKNDMVFCVQDNGNIAVESSINGICEDSISLSSQKSETRLFQFDELPFREGCQDISIRQSIFYSETKRDLNNIKFLIPAWNSLSIIAFSNLSSSRSLKLGECSIDKLTNDPHYRRTVVLLI